MSIQNHTPDYRLQVGNVERFKTLLAPARPHGWRWSLVRLIGGAWCPGCGRVLRWGFWHRYDWMPIVEHCTCGRMIIGGPSERKHG